MFGVGLEVRVQGLDLLLAELPQPLQIYIYYQHVFGVDASFL